MAKKDFRGLSSLIGGSASQQDEQSPGIAPRVSTGIGKQSGNTKMKGEKGYYRKTFLMDADLGMQIQAWSWYSRKKEKEIAEQAFRDYLSKVDQRELSEAILGFNKNS